MRNTGTPLIIEASLNGSASKEANPAVPNGDEEIVADGLFAPSTYLYRNDTQDSRYYVETCRDLGIGLEPFEGDRTPTNVELVEEVVEVARHHGRPVATPAEAAQILGLPTFPVPFAARRAA